MKRIYNRGGVFYVLGTRIMVDPVYNRFMKGESIITLARWFRCHSDTIEAAIRFRSAKTNEEAMEMVER